MATKKAKLLATRYLEDQAKIMKKHGRDPKLHGKRYNAAVKQVAKTFEDIATAR